MGVRSPGREALMRRRIAWHACRNGRELERRSRGDSLIALTNVLGTLLSLKHEIRVMRGAGVWRHLTESRVSLIDAHWHTMLVRLTPAAALAADAGYTNLRLATFRRKKAVFRLAGAARSAAAIHTVVPVRAGSSRGTRVT
jgi:hypothetical protein